MLIFVRLCRPNSTSLQHASTDVGAFFCYNEAMEEFAIKFQDGTVKDNGVNGLQVEEALLQCVERLREYQNKLPCRENSIAITHIETAVLWLKARTQVRIERGVEGTYEV